MSFSIFSGIKQCISNLVFGLPKRSLEAKNQDGEPPNKTAKMNEDSEYLNSILKKEMLKLIAECGKKQEEENKNLKMEIQTDKSEIQELREKNLKLLNILYQVEKNIEGIVQKPTQILEDTRSRIQKIMENPSRLVAGTSNISAADNNLASISRSIDENSDSNSLGSSEDIKILLRKLLNKMEPEGDSANNSEVVNVFLEESTKVGRNPTTPIVPNDTSECETSIPSISTKLPKESMSSCAEGDDKTTISSLVKTIQYLIAERGGGTTSENVSISTSEKQNANQSKSLCTSDSPISAVTAETSAAAPFETYMAVLNSTTTTAPTQIAIEAPNSTITAAPNSTTTTAPSETATTAPPETVTTAPSETPTTSSDTATAATSGHATPAPSTGTESGSKQIIPEVLDENLKFENIRGLEEQIKYLRQNIFIHLVNKDILHQCGVVPVRGLLFYGTETVDMALLAKTLTVELSRLGGKKYSFFQRFKEDVFSKYNGDCEKYVKSLFDEAVAKKPSVVYLEDVDTLYHWSKYIEAHEETTKAIISGMSQVKGLELIVIATTEDENKIAPVLRGPGRLEKSIAFTASSKERRQYILETLCSKWKQAPPIEIMEDMANKTENFSYEELKKLCSQSFLSAMHRKLATIEKERCVHCQTGDNLKIAASTLESVEVLLEDWNSALSDIAKTKTGLKPSSGIYGLSEQPKQSEEIKITGEVKITEEIKITEENPGFSSVGGLDQLIQNLRENIMFPFANKSALLDWGVEPVKGIIFHGPPGTGKTLLAKALAVELSRLGDQAFTFFYHKGTDCHNMYVGETGKNLKNIFAQAVAKKPAIIFFDEIDGLCAARTEGSGSSTFYNGVVTTMLGLLDSIKRGEVIVIAATNRIDSLDPALRRPGRFDKTIEFFPPKEEGRRAILKIHSSKWKGGCSEEILEEISKTTVGYTGADLEHLCRQTFLLALKRKFPDMKTEADCKTGSEKDELLKDLDILLQDWYTAMKTVKGSNSSVFGNSITSVKSVSPVVSKLLSGITGEILKKIESFVKIPQKSKPISAEKGCGINSFVIWDTGDRQAQIIDNFLIPSILTSPELKDAVSFTLNDLSKLPSLMSQLLSCSNLAILYIPRMDKLQIQSGESCAGENIHRSSLIEQIESLRGENILLLATTACPISQLPEDFRLIFKGMPDSREYKLRKLNSGECRGFFEPIFQERYPQLLEKVETITANANLYDLLDLKAELSRACVSGIEQDLMQSQVALNLQRILDEFRINKLDPFTSHNHMYT